MRWCSYLSVLLTCGLLLPSCSVDHGTEPLAGGGDDFPNPAIETVGSRIAADIDSAAAWRTTFAVPAEIPALAEHEPAPRALTKRGTLTRVAADTTLDSTELAAGIMRYCIADTLPGRYRYDTIAVRWDETAYDSIDGNEHLIALYGAIHHRGTFRIDRYRYEDADGDGLVYDSSTLVNRVWLTYAITEGLWRRTYRTLNDPGADNRFDTDDDRLLAAEATVLLGTDTVEHHLATDADGDSVLIAGGTDSCRVDLSSTVVALTGRSTLTARFMVFPADSTSNYCIRFAAAEVGAFNDTVWMAMTGTDGGEALPGDIARLVHVSTAAGSRSRRDTLAVTVLLGPDPADSLDDGLIAAYAHSVRPAATTGPVDATFWFENTGTPLTTVTSGIFTYALSYADGAWASLQGTFDPRRIEALWEDSAGNRLRVSWARDGTDPRIVTDHGN